MMSAMPQLLENQATKTWQFTPDKLTAILGTDSERGLAGQEVERRRSRIRPQRTARSSPTVTGEAVSLSVYERHCLGADRGGVHLRSFGRLARCGGDLGHCVAQRSARVRARVSGRAVLGGASENVGGDRSGVP